MMIGLNAISLVVCCVVSEFIFSTASNTFQKAEDNVRALLKRQFDEKVRADVLMFSSRMFNQN